jgi:tetratricopeptide repeat protein
MTPLACLKWRSVAVGLVASLVLGAAERAEAQTDSATARALFAEGRSLMEKDRYDEACPKFEESLRLDPGMGTQFNLAHCWEKLGRTASAWALFLDVAAAARNASQPQREAAARDRAKALEPKLSRLRIDVSKPSGDLKIDRDGQDVGRAAWGMAVPVDPGEHVVEVSAPGKKSWSNTVDVPSAARTVSVSIPELEDAPMPAAPPSITSAGNNPPPVEADVAPRSGGGGNGQMIAGYVVGGVGVAAVATGIVFGLQSRADNEEAKKLCPTQNPDGTWDCPGGPEERERHDNYVEDARREQTIGWVSAGVGVAALTTAVILIVTADSGPSDSAFMVAPVLTGDVRGAALSGHF